jgi:hypothetical protein
MTDNLRDLLAAVQLAHMPDDYERDMGMCPCGFKFSKWSELTSHVADKVIGALSSRSLIGYQIWNAAEWISVNSGWVPYEIHRNVDGTGGGWRITVQRIEADDDRQPA